MILNFVNAGIRKSANFHLKNARVSNTRLTREASNFGLKQEGEKLLGVRSALKFISAPCTNLPKWFNPCVSEMNPTFLQRTAKEKAELSKDIIKAVDEAAIQANLMREFFAGKEGVFGRYHFAAIEEMDELPNIRQMPIFEYKIGNVRPGMCQHLLHLRFENLLANCYFDFQRFCMGLEQVKWDQEHVKLDHMIQIRENETLCLTLLCKLWTAIEKINLKSTTPYILPPDAIRIPISAQVIPESGMRTYNKFEDFNMRAFKVYRLYCNGLNYAKVSFEFHSAYDDKVRAKWSEKRPLNPARGRIVDGYRQNEP